jgi:arylsulfatase A-like enzyme
MTAAYGAAVARADAAVARVLALADASFGVGKYSLIVTADHGGHDRNHGSDDPRDVTIPWIAWGQGVRGGELSGSSVRTMDTAATALWLLGVTAPEGWLGTPVTAAFQPAQAPTLAVQ